MNWFSLSLSLSLAPIPNVTLSSTSARVPLHTNYSSAILNCTGIVPLGAVGRLSILNPKQFSWTLNSVDITSSAVTDQNSLYFVYSSSTVNATYTTAGDYAYVCTVSIVSVTRDLTVSRSDSLTITVTGKLYYMYIWWIQVLLNVL